MKKLTLVLLLTFTCGMFFPFTGIAQVEKTIKEDYSTTLVIKINGEKNYYPLNGVEIINIMPSGNLLRIVTFKIDQDDPILEIANPVAFLRVSATGDFDGDGNSETIIDESAVLTKSGHLKLIYHINGNS